MKADSFLLYLVEDGLDNVIEVRKKLGSTNKASRELYQRCVKTMVQAGPKTNDTFAKNTGMMLEIVPTRIRMASSPVNRLNFAFYLRINRWPGHWYAT